jgi:formate-nitrite transporter family protein
MAKRVNELKEALSKPKQIDEILDEQIESALHEHIL